MWGALKLSGLATWSYASRPWSRRLARTARRLCVAFALIFLLVTFTPLVNWWATALAGPWQSPAGDVLIVLGGSLQDYGTVGGSSYWRAVYAAQAWKQGNFRTIVVSGGDQAEGNVAQAIGGFLEYQGVPPEAIVLESDSSSTRENAVHTAELLAGMPGRKVLLTSDYHMFRASRAFAKAGLRVETWPYPDVRKRATNWPARWPAFFDLIEESAKISLYYLRGWI